MTIAERITLARTNAGLSQTQAAKMLGTVRPTLWRWETGTHQPPIDVVKEMARIYGVSSCWLFTGEINENVAKDFALAISHSAGQAKADLLQVIALLETLEVGD